MQNIKLYNDDCLNVLAKLPKQSVDLVVCDLPYGTTLKEWDMIIPMEDYISIKIKNKIRKMSKEEWLLYTYKNNISYKDALEKFEKNKKLGLWTLYDRILKENGAVCLFGQEPFSTYIRNSNKDWYKYDIYWEKERLTNIQQVKKRVGKTVETISIFYKQQPTYNPQMRVHNGPLRRNKVKDGTLGNLVDAKAKKVKPYSDTGLRYPTQIWKYAREFLKEEHFDTQKPIALLSELILTFSNEGDTVLDNTMGWGSTGKAAVISGRDFIGIEINKDHFEKARNNIMSII